MQTADDAGAAVPIVGDGETAVAPQYAIGAAESLHGRRTLTLKHGDTFAVFNHFGDLCGRPAVPKASSIATPAISRISPDDRRRAADAAHLDAARRQRDAHLRPRQSRPDRSARRGGARTRPHPYPALAVSLERRLHGALAVRNFDDRPQSVQLEIAFAADFADCLKCAALGATAAAPAARGRARSRQAELHGLDERGADTLIRFDPAAERLSARRAHLIVELAPGEWRSIFIEVIAARRAGVTVARLSGRAARQQARVARARPRGPRRSRRATRASARRRAAAFPISTCC